MDRGGRSTETHAIAAALLDDLRFFQCHLLLLRHNNAVTGGFHFPERRLDFCVFLLNPAEFCENGEQIIFPLDFQTSGFSQNPIEQSLIQGNIDTDASGAHIHFPDRSLSDIGAGADGICKGLRILDGMDFRGCLTNAGEYGFPEPVVFFQLCNPVRHADIDFPYRERAQQFGQNGADVGFVQIRAADGNYRCAVLFGETLCQFPGGRLVGIQTVQQNGKGFSQFLQFGNDALFAGGIFCTGKICDAAVCGHNQADGGVLCNDLARAYLCRHVKRHLLFKPGGMYHTGLVVFDVSQGAGDNVAYAVNHAHPHFSAFSQGEFYGFLRDELRLCGHNGFSAGGLGQFIYGALSSGFALNVRNHQLFHKPFDKRGFSGTNRADHAYINITVCAPCNIRVNFVCHAQVPPLSVQWG